MRDSEHACAGMCGVERRERRWGGAGYSADREIREMERVVAVAGCGCDRVLFSLYMPITSRSTHSLCCSAVDAATTPHDTIPTWHSVAAESDAPKRASLSLSHKPTRPLSVCACLSLRPVPLVVRGA